MVVLVERSVPLVGHRCITLLHLGQPQLAHQRVHPLVVFGAIAGQPACGRGPMGAGLGALYRDARRGWPAIRRTCARTCRALLPRA